MRPSRISFKSDGLEIVGQLRLPDAASPAPAIVFTGPLSGVKEQVTGTYADKLAEAGFVTLAFDHRNFGESEGAPRQHEDPQGKLSDLGDAVSFLATLDEVDAERIGACGVCLGGGYALRFAAFEPRVKALVGIAGGYNDPKAMRDGMGADVYRQTLAHFSEVAEKQARTGEIAYMAAVADGGGEALMGGQEPFDYYGTERSTSPGWVNQLTALTVRALITTDLAAGADFISPTPFLVVHGRTDDYCSPEGAQSVFDKSGDPKEIVWLDTTNHIDLYDVPKYVDPAVEAAAAWFGKYL